MKTIRTLGPTRSAALGLMGIALVAFLFFGFRMATAPTYGTLYGGLDPAEAGSVVDALERSGFQVVISGGGSIIQVPEKDIARARMLLAEEGLPGEGNPGWEIFDEASGLGMNTFMQQVNRLRALEGELARSIRTIQGVEAARVHLVMPDREAFSRVRPEPSASVIVQTRPGDQLTRRQAIAIRALVASAVPSLVQSRVTILSATGEAILSEDDAADATINGMASNIEERLSRGISDILAARVGAGNVRISLKVDLETERQVIRSQSFDPEQQVVRSTETREEIAEDSKGAAPVDVGANLPDPFATGTGGDSVSNNSNSRSDAVVNYEIGNTQTEIVREPGDVRKISVAVLVNGLASTDVDGNRVYEERTPAELERLSELVRGAIGFDAARGDVVSVDSLQFADYTASIDVPPDPTLQDLIVENFDMILRGLFILIMTLMIFLFGVRPVLRAVLPERIFSKPGEPAKGEPGSIETKVIITQAGAVGADGKPVVQEIRIPSALPNFPQGVERQDDDLTMVRLDAVDGDVQKGWLNSLSMLVKRDPDDAIRVIQTWLSEDE